LIAEEKRFPNQPGAPATAFAGTRRSRSGPVGKRLIYRWQGRAAEETERRGAFLLDDGDP
jgi:hypothetical protein